MKLVAILAMVVAAAYARDLTVYVEDQSNPSAKLERAEVLANQIFARAGVKIDWRCGEPGLREKAMVVELVGGTPKDEMPGALAYALPYEGVHITVFFDRVQRAAEFELSPNDLLAHVMVHEIAHLLEGTSRHSETGIMKPNWTLQDVKSMRWRPLGFTEEDAELIRIGLSLRVEPVGTSARATCFSRNWTPGPALPSNEIKLRRTSKPTRASAADQGVRPTNY